MNVAKNFTGGEDDNYYEQSKNRRNIQSPSNDSRTTYSNITKTRTHPKVHEFKLKISDDAETTKLSDAELNKVVLWTNAAAQVKAILQKGDKIELKFNSELTIERTKLLLELIINNKTKINSLKDQTTLVPLNRTPLQADDSEISDYLAKFGTLKGSIRRKTCPNGPLKGLENGSITALMILKHPLPSYHYLRGKRFEAPYKGMNKTCYWCLEPGEKYKNFILGYA